jgi:chromate reductase
LLPEGVVMKIVGCGHLPFYNKDLDSVDKPASVVEFLQDIRAADALLIGCPEYNYSIPGVLKNAIDWASRPAYKSVLAGKPAAIVSGSPSPVGGARAQAHLCQVFAATLTQVAPLPAFLVPLIQEKFSADGVLQDEDTRHRLQRYLQQYVNWAKRISGQ